MRKKRAQLFLIQNRAKSCCKLLELYFFFSIGPNLPTYSHKDLLFVVIMQMSCSKVVKMESAWSWSSLPLELTGLILRCLPAHTNRLRFAAVCRNWRLSSRQHRLSPPGLRSLTVPSSAYLTVNPSSSRTVLAFTAAVGSGLFFYAMGACSLMNPFTKVTLTLPNQSSLFPIHEPADIVNGPEIKALKMGVALLNIIHGISIWKVIVCSPLLVAAIFVIGSIRTIGFCQTGGSTWYMNNFGKEKSVMVTDSSMKGTVCY
jgi:hypothetical protein